MHRASRIPSSLQRATAAARPPRAKEPRLRLNVLADTISTYLTLLSSVILPVLLILWARSYLVSDRFYRADDGVAIVAGLVNGEVAVWAGPTMKDLDLYLHRPRQSTWGQGNQRTFQRNAGRDHFWFAGFGYARSQRLPWRDVPLTGQATAVCVPLWFVALIVGALPFRLLARNMQSSADFLAERAAEQQTTRPI